MPQKVMWPCELASSPKETVAWIKEKLRLPVQVDVKRVESLIKELEDNQFKIRQKALAI